MPQPSPQPNDGHVAATTVLARDHDTAVRGAGAIAFEQLALVIAIEAHPQRYPGTPPREPTRDIGRLRVKIPPQSESGIRLHSARLALITGEGAGLRDAPSDDPVIQGLSEALIAVERMQQDHTALCADALRLAVVARLIALQSDRQWKLGERSGTGHCVGERPIQGLQKWRLKRVLDYIDSHFCRKIALADLAAAAGLSRMHFAAQFRAATGCRPHEFVLRQRIRRAKDLLRNCEMSIVEIALTVGFQSQAHFTTTFRRFTGDTPSRWRNAAAADFERIGTLSYDIALPGDDNLS
ncbi:AraC family transcriptional regulator [Bradyrhizobium sacchari]|uniref:AraC-like DNA-binding protein n=1 Tax=Bradyrhizobium sacchari TaxID=1399419 RepID=A0A560K050_9BRAD|nr:AraC family transcriptional regulator [Bradyrhizobium sacchari]OPY98801.1 AraC family transcriptional regulator [Bradyrhizobium sacchari]TWB60260.1 AraC-like DNA-binding protein [Bradyrhizobium sacchari]TWB73930.1 AraC-like DNA-binding protein [Bradyrhizobium sacchari]